MKNMNIKKKLKTGITGDIVVFVISIVLIYLLIALYFNHHFFLNTEINGVDVSLKEYDDADHIIRSYIQDYKIQLIERNMEVEEITGQDIGMQYNEENSISEIYPIQSSLKWNSLLFKDQTYYVGDLFIYNKDLLKDRINKLNCLNKDIIEPKNVSFKYSNGSYEIIEEVYGNKVNKDKLNQAIERYILKGERRLDLDKNLCYENPRYTLSSHKAIETKKLLDQYVSTKISYIFGNENEIVDGDIINQWLSVDEDLDILINENAVIEYVQGLSKKYDTVGVARKFKTSINKTVKVKGGFYGWKLNRIAEIKALLEDIKLGEVLQKEPIYTQKAEARGEDDIGDTYVEINITRQYLWFYKDGKLITQGAVVTGDINRENSTKSGVYMLNYKEKDSTLRGVNYENEVSYWMPFNGNIGIHDASWRHSFGGYIYKTNGSHGCVNAPLYLAKTIFDNIEEGTPVIAYEE